MSPYKHTLNAFMALGYEAWREARRTLQVLLSEHESTLRDDVSLRSRLVCLQSADADVHVARRLTSSSALPGYVMTCM